MRFLINITALASALLAAACSGEAAGSADDSADVPLNWTADDAIVITGRSSGEDFTRITGIATDGHSHIAVLERDLHRVSVFNSEGEFLWSAGRQGDGPGELQSPFDVSWGSDSSLYVTDIRHQRISRYAWGGTPVDDTPTPDIYTLHNMPAAQGWMVAQRALSDAEQTHIDQRLTLWRPDSLMVLDSVRFPLRPQLRKEVCPGVNVSSDRRPLFEPALIWASNGKSIAWRGAWQDYRVMIRDSAGAIHEVARSLPIPTATEEDAIAASGGRQEQSASGCSYDATDLIRARGWAEQRSLILNLRVRPDGELWVNRLGTEADSAIDVFSAQGSYVGTIVGTVPLPSAFLGEDLLVYRETSPAGAPVVRIARLVRRN